MSTETPRTSELGRSSLPLMDDGRVDWIEGLKNWNKLCGQIESELTKLTAQQAADTQAHAAEVAELTKSRDEWKARHDSIWRQGAQVAEERDTLRSKVERLTKERDAATARATELEAACSAKDAALTEMLLWFGNPRAKEWASSAMHQAAIGVEKRAKAALATTPAEHLTKFKAAEADAKPFKRAIEQLEKLAWSGKVNHYAIAPYRVGQTDEKRYAILAIPDKLDVTCESEELGDGATLVEAIENAMKEAR